jgi:hypothetical protein
MPLFHFSLHRHHKVWWHGRSSLKHLQGMSLPGSNADQYVLIWNLLHSIFDTWCKSELPSWIWLTTQNISSVRLPSERWKMFQTKSNIINVFTYIVYSDLIYKMKRATKHENNLSIMTWMEKHFVKLFLMWTQYINY